MKNNKAFTLIELLAIIVILAIIAVITVPIILNIIENSRKGAAIDSAYGYKDSIGKYYVSELSNNRNLQLEGDYVVTNGKLSGVNLDDVEIPIEGTIPISGSLSYSNNILKSGCLIIGEYAVTFQNSNVINSEKNGKCVIKIPTCPDCVFRLSDESRYIDGIDVNDENAVTSLEESEYTNDYLTLNSNYFLGHILDENKIQRSFVCGIKDSKPFCLEGYNGSAYQKNVEILNSVYPNCNASASASGSSCISSMLGTDANAYGSVTIHEGESGCSVSSDGNSSCY